MAPLLKEERQEIILDMLRDSRQVTVAELSEHFDVSEVTIRRDLSELAEHGYVKRAHGGAIATPVGPTTSPVIRRMNHERQYKEAIGRAAAKLIQDGDTIFLGAGSTTAHVARQLVHHKDLTVVTNALNIANEFSSTDEVTVVVTGGVLHKPELSLIGHIANQALDEVLVDKVIVAIPALSLEAGLTNDYLPEVMTDRAILEMSETLIVVADATKFGKVESALVAPIQRITTLVTDDRIGETLLENLKGQIDQVIVVETEEVQSTI